MNVRRKITYAEIYTGGKGINCPKCNVAFYPHIGNLLIDKFQCGSCKAYIMYADSPVKSEICVCCTHPRPSPKNLNRLVCGGCNAIVIHSIYDRDVICYLCKHVTPNVSIENYGVNPVNPVLPNPIFVPKVYSSSPSPSPSPSVTFMPDIYVIGYPNMSKIKREMEEDKKEDSVSKKIRL